MFITSFSDKIQKIQNSIVAIGFNPNPQKVTIIGSGFCVSDDGKILTAAHLLQNLSEEQRDNLKAFVVIERREEGDFARYQWIPIRLLVKEDYADAALFQLAEYKNILAKPLELEDSDKVMMGQEAYFIGFPYAAKLINDGFGVTLIVNKTIVSNVKRDGVDPVHKRNWFILDAISNPGNSGCPLVNAVSNKVIGVMTVTFDSKYRADNVEIRVPMHICAAKPINLAKTLLSR